MEAFDQNNYITIGKYCISKHIMMSEPTQLYVTNTETNECKLHYEYKVFELLENEGLDTEPLHDYFDGINGTTKEERKEIIRKFGEWEEARKEDRKQLNRLDKRQEKEGKRM